MLLAPRESADDGSAGALAAGDAGRALVRARVASAAVSGLSAELLGGVSRSADRLHPHHCRLCAGNGSAGCPLPRRDRLGRSRGYAVNRTQRLKASQRFGRTLHRRYGLYTVGVVLFIGMAAMLERM